MQLISSRDNPLLKRMRALAGSPRECRKRGETLLDGAHLVQAALNAGIVPKALACAQGRSSSPEIAQLLARAHGPVPVLLPDALFEQISPVESPTGLVALIDIPVPPEPVIAGDLVVLDAVQDAGNLGTILRTTAAAGISQVLLTPGCAQAWAPRVLRAGMGAHFALRIVEHADAAVLLRAYPGRILATLPGEGTRSLFDTALGGAVAWLFGSEGAGLSGALAGLATERVRIPLSPASESLNVAAAVAVCLFEQRRQRAVS